jgi:hypothetical protein
MNTIFARPAEEQGDRQHGTQHFNGRGKYPRMAIIRSSVIDGEESGKI